MSVSCKFYQNSVKIQVIFTCNLKFCVIKFPTLTASSFYSKITHIYQLIHTISMNFYRNRGQ